jgi:hypothetical protein
MIIRIQATRAPPKWVLDNNDEKIENGRRIMSKRSAPGASVVAVVSYVLFCLFWFDTGLKESLSFLPAIFRSPAIPALLFLVSLGVLLRRKGFPRLFGEKSDNRLALLFFGLTLVSRIPLVAGAYGIPSSDAAVHGVMSLHILEGKHHPVFAYGESYDGSLKAHLTALLTLVSGEPVMSFTAAGVLLYAGFVVALFALARTTLTRGEAAFAAVYAVLSPGFLTAWGVKADGSYLEVLFLGTALLALGARLLADPEGRTRRAFWMGVLGGLALWAHILSTYYLLTTFLVLIAADWSRQSFRRLAVFLGGFLLGNFPVFVWNLSRYGQSYRWWTQDQSSLAERVTRTVTQLQAAIVDSLPVLTGWWPMELPSGPVSLLRIVLIVIFPVAGLGFVLQKRDRLRELLRGRLTPEAMLVIFAVLVVAIFAQSTFGWLTKEPRYLIFLFSVVPIFLASSLSWLGRRSRLAAGAIAGFILAINIYGSGFYCLRALESDAVNRQFVRELEELGVRYAYTDYYISYKYNFLSHGRLVLTSELGPEQTERYLPYRDEIAKAEKAALIPRSFRMARRIGRRLDAQGVDYRRKDLLYPVIYDLSEPVRLEWLR